MTVSPPDANWRALHGGLLFLLLLLPQWVPLLARWPMYLLGPFLAYVALVIIFSPLRRTCRWFALGRWDRTAVGATVGIILASSSALVLYQAFLRPDVTTLAAKVPVAALGGPVWGGACFALLNAFLEEVVFRGVLYDALDSQWGWPVAVVVSAAAFGVGHLYGYPPGAPGAFLAGLYGLLVGLLRWRTQGLLAPFVAHVFVDATIVGIFAHAGAF